MKRASIAIVLSLLFATLVAGIFILIVYFDRPDIVRGDYASIENYLTQNLQRAADERALGCAGLVLVENGKVYSKKCFGRSSKDKECSSERSLFTVASVSKAATALGALVLVEKNLVGLDEPILSHLTRWKFPGSEKALSTRVTMRNLLSHISGMVDGFGTGGFPLDSAIQSLTQYLDNPMYTNMGTAHPTIVTMEPGKNFAYSTMGYAVLQLMIEDRLGIPFHVFMRDSVFGPLQIARSSYDFDEIISRGDAQQLVSNYDENLSEHPHTRHASQAGAALKLTVEDMGRLICAFVENPLLDETLLSEMLRPQPGTFGSWGLGLELYGKDRSIGGHGGGAFPRSGASLRVNPKTGNGIGIMMAGGREMIDPHINAWMYWETGESPFDIRQVLHQHGKAALIIVILGVAGIFFFQMRNRDKPTRFRNR